MKNEFLEKVEKNTEIRMNIEMTDVKKRKMW